VHTIGVRTASVKWHERSSSRTQLKVSRGEGRILRLRDHEAQELPAPRPLELLLASAALPLVGNALLLAYTPQVEPHLRIAGISDLVAFALASAVLCGLALMKTQVLALFAGYALGLWTALGVVYVGIVGAAVPSFAIARRISGPAFFAAIEASPRAATIHAALVRDPRGALTTTALLRLSPTGTWNRHHIRLDGGDLTLEVNGAVQNCASWCDEVPGKICLRSEGVVIELRKVTLPPIER
jgi:hypothetical protein